jgi:uncharacterized coiled-coil DUF342 family protein
VRDFLCILRRHFPLCLVPLGCGVSLELGVTNLGLCTEREVKKATRDLNQLLSNIESPMTKLETVHKKYTELLADMKKLDRDYSKSKKRADQLQKDQDKGKSDLNKTVTMKDKLEKLCRELTKENKKVKVGPSACASKRLRQTPWRTCQLNHLVG